MTMLILGKKPHPDTLQLSLRNPDTGQKSIIGELSDPQSKLLIAGGPLPVVATWLEENGYQYVAKTRGIWARRPN